MQLTADEFNAAHIIGTRVVVKHPTGQLPDKPTRIKSTAWESVLDGKVRHLVRVDDINIPIPLTNIHLPEKFTGEQQATHGMEKSGRHADAVRPGWTQDAFNLLETFINCHLGEHGTFTTEQFRLWAYENDMIESPPRDTAWGGVIKKASALGLIRRKGWDEATTPSAHRRTVAIWEKMPPSGF